MAPTISIDSPTEGQVIAANVITSYSIHYTKLYDDGFSKGKALLYNFFSALTAFLGAGLVLLVSLAQDRVTLFLVPFAAGGFIYIAMADMIPELHKKKTQTFAQSFNQVAFFVLGIFVMWTMLFLE